jgi:hypothetical protein
VSYCSHLKSLPRRPRSDLSKRLPVTCQCQFLSHCDCPTSPNTNLSHDPYLALFLSPSVDMFKHLSLICETYPSPAFDICSLEWGLCWRLRLHLLHVCADFFAVRSRPKVDDNRRPAIATFSESVVVASFLVFILSRILEYHRHVYRLCESHRCNASASICPAIQF